MLYSLYAVVIRILAEHLDDLNIVKVKGPVLAYLHAALGVPFLAYYAYHVHFLAYRSFDYGYNMSVNLTAGKICDSVKISEHCSNIDSQLF